ncbi:hypothetical protein ACLKA7_006171 [Drosophila subpalustris]
MHLWPANTARSLIFRISLDGRMSRRGHDDKDRDEYEAENANANVNGDENAQQLSSHQNAAAPRPLANTPTPPAHHPHHWPVDDGGARLISEQEAGGSGCATPRSGP